MQKKLLSGLFWLLLANLIVKPLWILGIEVGVQNAVGNSAYGFYFAIFNLAYIFNILLDLGVSNFNTRNIAQHPQLITKHLSGILSIKLLLFLLYLVVTFTVGVLMGYGSDEFRLLAWLTVAQFLNSLILYLRSNFEGLLLFKWDSLFSVLDRILMILICGTLLLGPKLSIFNFHFSIFHFVYAQVAAYVLTALLALVVIARKTHLSLLLSPFRSFSLPFMLVILRKSAPFALLVLLMASYNRIDPILLRALASDADAGIYAGAFRLLDALTMVCYLVSVPLLPVFSKLCSTRKNETDNFQFSIFNFQLQDALRLVFWPLMLFAIGAAVLCALFAEPLMELLYPSRGELYVPAFRVVIFGLVPIAVTYIFGTLLTAGGHLRQLNLFAATSLLLNIVVNLLLIPRFGATGSAWASLTAQTFMALTQLLLAIRLFHLPASTFRFPTLSDIKNSINLFRNRE